MMIFIPGPYYIIDFDEKTLIGLPLKNIIGVYPLGEITPFPNPTKNLVGMGNLEGRIVPIQDSISLFDYKMDEDEGSYIILISTYLGEFGFIVPRHFNVIGISKEQIENAKKNYDEKNYKNLLIIKTEKKDLIMMDIDIPYEFGEIEDQLLQLFTQKALEINS